MQTLPKTSLSEGFFSSIRKYRPVCGFLYKELFPVNNPFIWTASSVTASRDLKINILVAASPTEVFSVALSSDDLTLFWCESLTLSISVSGINSFSLSSAIL